MTTASLHSHYDLTPYLHSASVDTALAKFRPIPQGLANTFSSLLGLTQTFYSELLSGYDKLSRSVEGDGTDARSQQNAFVVYSALSHLALTSIDEVSAIIRYINQELEANSRPRPVSDNPETAKTLITRAKTEIEQVLQPTSEFAKTMEKLFSNSLSNGDYAKPYVLADAEYIEPLILKLAPHLLETYRTKLHPQFLKNLATSRTREYVDALSKAHELLNVPLLMRHGWANLQEQLPANVKAAIRAGV